ncbi:MAG TPA: Rieske 2Fe-2S domain-containing protein [Actinomycetota bacterium]|nr:Rieske 2Fe-2S domain-containing protein [Actinomycetota bacterium]
MTCPWHGSEFDLETGAVVRGPAVTDSPPTKPASLGTRWRSSCASRSLFRSRSLEH